MEEKELHSKSHIISGNRIRSVLLLFLLSLNPALYSQSDNFPLGTRAAALSNAYSAESDLWSVQHNQAGLGFYPKLTFGLHHENKFATPDYNLHAAALTIPVNAGTFGVSYSYFGFTAYNESKVGLAFGKKFGEKFSAGVQLNYHYNFIMESFGNRNALSFEGGIQFRPANFIKLGAHLFNPTRSRISYNQDTIPTVFRTGLSITPLESLNLLFQLEKRLDQNLRIQSGLEYQLLESLYLRAGIMTDPFTSTFGLGYEINRISADIAFSRHPILGFTPHFSLQVNLRTLERSKNPG